ncbi:MAG: hypothetical protein ACRC0L_08700 [Angustibacter sp.]
MPYDLSQEQDREDRRKHLDIIQAVVARQAASSVATKGWAITLAAAIFGVAVVRENAYLILLGVVAVVVLSIADSLYLNNEQRFRDLYDAVARNEVEPFSMAIGVVSSGRTRNKSYWSWSVAFVYAPLLGACIVLSAVALVTSSDNGADVPPRQPTRSETPR